MKFRWDNRYLHWGVTAFLVVAASMLFYYGIFHMKSLLTGIRTLFGIMAPIIYGIAIAFLLCPVLNYMEQQIVYPLLEKKGWKVEKKGQKAIRWICVILSISILLIVIYALLMMILPELIRSITNLVYSFPHYVNVVQKWLDTVIAKGWDLDASAVEMVEEYSLQAQNYLTTTLLPQLQGMLKNISSGLFDVFIFLKNFIIGVIVSMYILSDKEGFVAKGKMIAYAMFPTERANFIIHAMRFTSQTFIGFISGKILDSAIIGVLCYIGCNILNMPYVILVSVVVGVTNVIPFFGPYLGAIPCIFLILLVDPLKALYFALFILALQQFDGNILGPMILGESTGLSSFMVIVAILIGGGVFGVPGMIIGVPVCAVLYAAFQKVIRMVLEGKDIPCEEEEYRDMDCLDAVTRERLLMPKKERSKNGKAHQRTALMEFLMTIFLSLKKIVAFLWLYLRKAWAFCRRKAEEWRQLYEIKKKEKEKNKKSGGPGAGTIFNKKKKEKKS